MTLIAVGTHTQRRLVLPLTRCFHRSLKHNFNFHCSWHTTVTYVPVETQKQRRFIIVVLTHTNTTISSPKMTKYKHTPTLFAFAEFRIKIFLIHSKKKFSWNRHSHWHLHEHICSQFDHVTHKHRRWTNIYLLTSQTHAFTIRRVSVTVSHIMPDGSNLHD